MNSKTNGVAGGDRAYTWMGVRFFRVFKLLKDYKERWKL